MSGCYERLRETVTGADFAAAKAAAAARVEQRAADGWALVLARTNRRAEAPEVVIVMARPVRVTA